MPKSRTSGRTSAAAASAAAEMDLPESLAGGLGGLGSSAGAAASASTSTSAPGTALAHGLRRIHSSPALALQAAKGATSSASSRKKSASSTELKNIQATKAARRLARKAEAARQSRRRKKAALSSMEQTLLDLETRHAELLQMQGHKQSHQDGRRSSGGMGPRRGSSHTLASDSYTVASSRPGSPRSIAPMMPSLAPMPAGNSSRSDSTNTPSSPGGGALSPPPPLTSSSSGALAPGLLTARFQAILTQLSAIRSEEINEKTAFLQQHTTSRGLSDVLIWLLAQSREYNQHVQSRHPGVEASFVPASSLPPSLETLSPISPSAAWNEVLRMCGLSDKQMAALLDPHLGTSAASLSESLEALRQALQALRPRLGAHTRERDAHNRALYSIFNPRQREVLAATAFKQQQQQQQAQQQLQLQQQQQAQQQYTSPQPVSGQLMPSALPHSQLAAQALQQQQLKQHMAIQQQHVMQNQQQQRQSSAVTSPLAGAMAQPQHQWPQAQQSSLGFARASSRGNISGAAAAFPSPQLGASVMAAAVSVTPVAAIPAASGSFSPASQQRAQLQAHYMHHSQQQQQQQQQQQMSQQQQLLQQQFRPLQSQARPSAMPTQPHSLYHELDHADDHGN